MVLSELLKFSEPVSPALRMKTITDSPSEESARHCTELSAQCPLSCVLSGGQLPGRACSLLCPHTQKIMGAQQTCVELMEKWTMDWRDYYVRQEDRKNN